MRYEYKFYIKDANKKWVDFSDRFRNNRLTNAPVISHNTENKVVGGVLMSSLSNISMDNSDGFWDSPSMWQSLKTVDGSDSSWNLSKSGMEIQLEKSYCRIEVVKENIDFSISRIPTGIFRVSSYSTSLSSGTASLKVESLSMVFSNIKAEKVRDGRSWYTNRSLSFLFEELLKLEFTNADISGTITSSSETNLIDSDVVFPDWVKGAVVFNSTQGIYGVVDEIINSSTLGVSMFDSSFSSWAASDEYTITGQGTLPSYFSFPRVFTIPTFDNVRAVSSYGRPPDRFV